MEEIKSKLLNYLPSLASALIIVLLGLLAAFIVVKIAKQAMTHHKVDLSLSAFITKAIRILIYTFTGIAALSELGISTAGIIAFFSAAVAALALALKDRLSDLASGIVILFTKPFITGDFIEFGSHKGFVQKIDIMHTNLLTYDDTNVIIPNSVISSSEVTNYTAHPQVRVMVDVPIPYDADIGKVKEILYGTLAATENILTDREHTPAVRLERYGESALEFTARCWCDYQNYWKVYYSLTERIKEALDHNGVSIPFNQMDVHIVENGT